MVFAFWGGWTSERFASAGLIIGHCGRVEDDAFVVNGRIVRILGGCLTCLARCGLMPGWLSGGCGGVK